MLPDIHLAVEQLADQLVVDVELVEQEVEAEQVQGHIEDEMHHESDSQEPEDIPKPCIGPADTEVVPQELILFLLLQEHLHQHLSYCQDEKTICEVQCYVSQQHFPSLHLNMFSMKILK